LHRLFFSFIYSFFFFWLRAVLIELKDQHRSAHIAMVWGLRYIEQAVVVVVIQIVVVVVALF